MMKNRFGTAQDTYMYFGFTRYYYAGLSAVVRS